MNRKVFITFICLKFHKVSKIISASYFYLFIDIFTWYLTPTYMDKIFTATVFFKSSISLGLRRLIDKSWVYKLFEVT